MVVIINYGLGNLASVLNMVRKVGGKGLISDKKEDILSAEKLILPGVGSFDYGINQLKSNDLFSVIQYKCNNGAKILGICLGMQLLSNGSEEGNCTGLELVDATFKRFSFDEERKFNIPHVGWNNVTIKKDNYLMPYTEDELRFYFTHSYHAVCKNQNDIIATTDYGYQFPSAYQNNNIYGVQFHPEKSHRFGMSVIKNFLSI